ncbi:MAG: MFS transporter [Actinomycetota bacterium]
MSNEIPADPSDRLENPDHTGAAPEGDGGSGGGGGAFVSFKSPGYPPLFMAGLFAFISVQMQFLLRGILAWDLTERESALGVTYLAFGLAMLVATPLGGVASDRLSKRSVLLFSQGVIMVMAVSMGAAVVTGVVQFWMLVVAAVAQGVAFGFFGPARVAISSELVGRDHLGNAITLSLLSLNGTRVFAPSLAGVLAGIATVGIGGAYLIAGAASIAGLLFLFRVPDTSKAGAVETTGSTPSVAPDTGTADASDTVTADSADTRRTNPIEELVEGVRYVVDRRPLRRVVLTSFFVVMFGFNYIAFYPALVKGVFERGDASVGFISTVSAIGAVLISLPLAAKANSPWARMAMVAAGLGFGLGVAAVGLSPSFLVACAVVFFVGAATTTFQSLSNTLALNMADESHQGRVQSLMQLSFAGFGLAALPIGVLAEVIGLQPTIVIMGSIAAGAAAVYAVLEGGWAGLRPTTPDADGDLATVGPDDHLARPAAARP